MEPKAKKVRVFVAVSDHYGTTIGYQWIEVDGFEFDLSGTPPLKNGEALSVTYTAVQSKDAQS